MLHLFNDYFAPLESTIVKCHDFPLGYDDMPDLFGQTQITVTDVIAWCHCVPAHCADPGTRRWLQPPLDNAYAESLFRTAKYRPEFPTKGFSDLDQARIWAANFVHWYNFGHRHSGIRYVSPAHRHAGDDHAILAARHALYLQARERNPARWSGDTRNWVPIGAVTLNPDWDSILRTHLNGHDIRPLAA